nr:MAG TPA: hypothetical protein [Bacteriophage sp.]
MYKSSLQILMEILTRLHLIRLMIQLNYTTIT